jgi:hypothetical protein
LRSAFCSVADADAGGAFATPTIVHFMMVLAISAILSAPWKGIEGPIILWALGGLTGIVYVLIIARRMRRQSAYAPQLEDWLFHVLLPVAAYLAFVVCAYAARCHVSEALFGVGAAALPLLLAGIHNAWDAVTYNVFVKKPTDQKTNTH